MTLLISDNLRLCEAVEKYPYLTHDISAYFKVDGPLEFA